MTDRNPLPESQQPSSNHAFEVKFFLCIMIFWGALVVLAFLGVF